MRIITAADIAEVADFRDLVETLRETFRRPPIAPCAIITPSNGRAMRPIQRF